MISESEADAMMELLYWYERKVNNLGSTFSQADVAILNHMYDMHKLRDREFFWECGYLIGYDQPRFVWLALREMQTHQVFPKLV